MKRPLAIAVLTVILILPLTLPAQYRSGPRSFASTPVRMAPVRLNRMRPGSSTFRSGPSRPFRPGSPKLGSAPITGLHFVTGPNPGLAPGYFAGSPCFTNPSYSGSFFCSQFLNNRKPRFGGGAFVPIYWLPSNDDSQTEETSPPQAEADNSIANQVQALTDEVEMLREEQSTRRDLPPSEAEPRASAPEKPLNTVLVYRDGRHAEVQDYAILGKTLWIFAGQTTKKVPLSDLDLDGTIKLNDDRGVEFISPGTL
jgi:hypothetical protein